MKLDIEIPGKIIFALGLSLAIGNPAHAADLARISDIEWLAGQWEGVGDDGSTKGEAMSVWTGPVEGSMSWTFRWHVNEQNHVHFAFSVFEETERGVVYRGIHYGTDFESFEDAPWRFRLASVDGTKATFACMANCRAPGVEFNLLPDGRLIETWQTARNDEVAFVVTYNRVQ